MDSCTYEESCLGQVGGDVLHGVHGDVDAPVQQGLTLVHFADQRKHCLWDEPVERAGWFQTQNSTRRVSQVELKSGLV